MSNKIRIVSDVTAVALRPGLSLLRSFQCPSSPLSPSLPQLWKGMKPTLIFPLGNEKLIYVLFRQLISVGTKPHGRAQL